MTHYALQGLGAPTIHPAVLRRFKSYGKAAPAALFFAGEQGAWYDPSDFSTMFQDTAGSTPVTAVEQPVGRINDKSGRGNNATQGTAAARPTLRARYNLLTYSEQFNNAAWTDFGTPSVSANAAVAPDGTTTADLVTIATSGHGKSSAFFSAAAAVNHALVLHVKANVGTQLQIMLNYYNAGSSYLGQDAQTITIASGTDLGNGWYRHTLSGTTLATTAFIQFRFVSVAASNSFYIWGADLRVTNDGVGLPVYQRIAAATDYDTAGFPPYLAFDGTDDGLVTSAIDFSATDEMTIVAGVRSLRAAGMIYELSATTDSNDGSLHHYDGGSTSLQFISKGTTARTLTPTVATGPLSWVSSAVSDISVPSMEVRLNGASAASSALTQGTGNFGNHIFYIGSRGGSAFRFNGRLYGLIIRGKTTDVSQLSAIENWMNTKTRAF
jgi:hypothetical protein